MPRITTGSAKNKQITVPDIPEIRVVQDVLKLALFAIIGERIVDASCLDLYAGSGSLGIEALSRGALKCTFIDESKKAVTAIEKNIKLCGFENKSFVKQDNATKFAANTNEKFDIIFVDPFYNDIKHKFLFQNLEEILTEKGIIAFSHGRELKIDDQIANTNLIIETTRRFGRAHITLFVKK